MRLLVDENLPPRLARWLETRGCDAQHVKDVSLLGAPDAAIAHYARREARAIVTRDSDYDAIAHASGILVIRIRRGNCGADELLLWLDQR